MEEGKPQMETMHKRHSWNKRQDEQGASEVMESYC
jgi:hypothetical protein